MAKEKLKGQATQEQIKAWKDEHGDVYAIEVEDSVCYLKKPTKRHLSAANAAGKTDPFKFNETLIRMLWLGGDEAIRTDDVMFMSVAGVLDELIEVKVAEVKKL